MKRVSLLKNNNNKYLKATALTQKVGTCEKVNCNKVLNLFFRGRRLAV